MKIFTPPAISRKSMLVCATLFFFAMHSNAQTKNTPDVVNIERNKKDNTVKHIAFAPSAKLHSADAPSIFKNYLGMNNANGDMILQTSTPARHSTNVDRYTQYYKHIKVINGSYSIMSKNDNVGFMTGNYYNVTANMSARPKLTEAGALHIALKRTGAELYAWDVPGLEQNLKTQAKDPKATHYPKGTLVWVEDYLDGKDDRKLHLAYEFNIYAMKPLSREMVYVDANTGKILHINQLLENTGGTGPSLYSGSVAFKTSILSGINRLRDSTRGGGINTFSLNNTAGSIIADLTSSTTTWATNAALDAHWGAEKVYDYWHDVQGRNSYDNAGAAINSYVHFGINYNNAYWDGVEMVYGDGSGIASGGFSPLVSLDVCAHEIGHGVCQHTAGLAYNKESGGMNEGFSDIWGAVIENFANPHETDARAKNMWIVGEEISASGLRSMSNPKSHGQPDTYGGTYWYNVSTCTPSSANDQCGVHTNSGVLNRWFYLLSMGGSGTNDIGSAYSLTGIGINTAADITYQTELLLPGTATYAVCRSTSISVAGTLYGTCSPEVAAVTKAWYAVGVGANYTGGSIPAITGTALACAGNTTTLANVTTGGTWSSSNTGIAIIGSATGVVTGVAPGSSSITYTIAGGCYAAKTFTVSANPAAISGASSVCPAATLTLAGTPAGGSWSGSTPAVATVGTSSGIVTGVSVGTSAISYTASASCGVVRATRIISVDTTVDPGTISGTSSVCVGGTLSLSASVTAGTWSSSAIAVATINASGLVTGIAPGTVVISYTVNNSCNTALATKIVTVNGHPDAGTISGPTDICAGSNIILTDSIAGGVWSSSNANATVAGGTVYGVAAGAAIISYTVTAEGCSSTATVGVTISSIATVNTVVIRPHFNGQESYIGIIDASCNPTDTTHNSPNAPHTIYCPAGWTISGCPVIKRNIFKFADLADTAMIPRSGVVVSARLYLYGVPNTTTGDFGNSTFPSSPYTSYGANTGWLYELNTSFDPATATWDNQPAVKHTDSIAIAASASRWGGNDTLDVTSMVADMVANTNTGFEFKMQNETPYHSRIYASSRYADSSLHPMLVVTFAAPLQLTGTPEVCVGSSTSFTAPVAGGTWSSANDSIAGLAADGTITGITTGTTAISYSYVSSCGINTLVKSVTVSNSLPVITAYSLSAGVCVGSAIALSYLPAGGTWSSSNTAVASVSATGVVTGITEGTTTITYTAINSCGSTIATSTVTVAAVTAVAAIGGVSSVIPGGTITLTNSTPGGIWTSGNSHATVSSAGIVTGVSGGTVTITYTVSTSCGNVSATKLITVGTAVVISGTLILCSGSTTSLSASPAGGTWSSSAASVATVNAAGIVTGFAAGTSVITYAVAGSYATVVVAVSAPPAAITGATYVCAGAATTLSSATTGGFWNSGNAGIATADAITGEVSGVAAGSVAISYSLGSGCFRVFSMTVKPAPAAIAGPASACAGGTAIYTDASPIGVSWSSSNTAIATIGTGSGLLTGIAPGTVTIAYLNNTGCIATRLISVNSQPSVITGSPSVCVGSAATFTNPDAGGTWSSSSAAVAVVGSNTGIVTGITTGSVNITYTLVGCSRTTPLAVVAAPAAITGVTTLCAGSATTLSSATSGGTWSSGTPSVATVATMGIVTGVSAGTSIISYTISGGCSRTTTVTVGSSVAATTGTPITCVGLTTSLANATAGGTWSSNMTSVAVVSAAGVVTGLAPGTTNITYTVAGGCNRVTYVTVNGSVPSITGTASVCMNASTTLNIAATGGIWSSGNAAIGAVSTTGIVTGIAAGTVPVSYMFTNGCYRAVNVTVKALPAAIAGNMGICVGGTSVVTDATATGVSWSSSTPSIATIGAGSGLVTGIAPGTSTITYLVSSGCIATTIVTVDAVPATASVTGPSSVAIGATITLANAIPGGIWSSSNTAKATVSTTGVVTGVATAAATISYRLANGVCMVPLVKALTITTAKAPAADVVSVSGFRLFPNPSNGIINIQAQTAGTLTVYTLEGKEVMRINVAEGATTCPLPQELAAGTYMCRYNGADGGNVMVRLIYEP